MRGMKRHVLSWENKIEPAAKQNTCLTVDSLHPFIRWLIIAEIEGRKSGKLGEGVKILSDIMKRESSAKDIFELQKHG